MKHFFAAGMAAMMLAGCQTPGSVPPDTPTETATASCPAGTLGVSRTLVLPREGAGYGTVGHEPLPLEKGEIVLTFDDGPEPVLTRKVLDALAAECTKASFFMIGEKLVRNPALAREVAAAGNSVGMHSLTHAHLGTLTPGEQIADLEATEAAFEAVFGYEAPAYRFPFLEETPTLIDALKDRNVTVMSIDMAITDWVPEDTTETLVAKLKEQLLVHDRGIILMHDANGPTAEALPALLRTLKEEGYTIVQVVWED